MKFLTKDGKYLKKGGNFLVKLFSESETGAVLAYATANGYQIPSDQYITKLDNHIRDLKAFGLWNKMDLAYWMVGDGDMNFKTINIIDPSAYKGTLHGGLVNTSQGIESNGVDGYIDTNAVLNTTINYTRNYAGRHGFVYKLSNGQLIDGAASGNYLNYLNISNAATQRINNTGSSLNQSVDMSGLGYKSINRVSTVDVILYNEDAEYIRLSSPSTIPDHKQLIMAIATSSGIVSQNVSMSCYALGAALIGQDAINYRQAIINNL